MSPAGVVAGGVRFWPTGQPPHTQGCYPRRSEVLAATPQQSCGLDSSGTGPGRGLGLAPPHRGPAPLSTCDLVSSVPAWATGSAAGALSLEGANKGLLIGKTFPTPGIGVQRSLFKTSCWGCIIIYPRLPTYHLRLLDQQMLTRFPPLPNKCRFGLFINPRGFSQIQVKREASKH